MKKYRIVKQVINFNYTTYIVQKKMRIFFWSCWITMGYNDYYGTCYSFKSMEAAEQWITNGCSYDDYYGNSDTIVKEMTT